MSEARLHRSRRIAVVGSDVCGEAVAAMAGRLIAELGSTHVCGGPGGVAEAIA